MGVKALEISEGALFEAAMHRPEDYEDLSPESQWAIDKTLGILDWNGGCAHADKMCAKCKERFDKRFKIGDRNG